MHEGGGDLMATNQICVTSAEPAAVRLDTFFSLDQMLVAFPRKAIGKRQILIPKKSM